MRVLVCGDREWKSEWAIRRELEKLPRESIIIQGMCRGADLIARKVALSLDMEVLDFPADWAKYGRGAGPIRNKQMLDEGQPDLVLAFHSHIDDSKGTKNMMTQAAERGIEVKLFWG